MLNVEVGKGGDGSWEVHRCLTSIFDISGVPEFFPSEKLQI